MKDDKKIRYSVKENKKRQRKIIDLILILFILLIVTTGGCSKREGNALTELNSKETEQKSSRKEEAQKSKTEGRNKDKDKNTVDSMVKSQEEGTPSTVFVYVCGAVNTPGVYELSHSSRVYEAIAMAGGLTPDAAGEVLNQARLVKDGERIYIPSKADLEKGLVPEETGQNTASKASQGNYVNINTATREELKSLPGIGDAKADSIISHREDKGPFTSIEGLMQVEGIKEGLYNKIKDRITS